MSEKVTLPIVINVTEDQACWVGAWMCARELIGLPGMSLLEAIQQVFDLGVEQAQKVAEEVRLDKPEDAWKFEGYLREPSGFRIGWQSHAGKPPMRLS